MSAFAIIEHLNVIEKHGSTKDVRQHVKKLAETLGDGGGYIFGTAHNLLPDTPTENILALVDAYHEFGQYWRIHKEFFNLTIDELVRRKCRTRVTSTDSWLLEKFFQRRNANRPNQPGDGFGFTLQPVAKFPDYQAVCWVGEVKGLLSDNAAKLRNWTDWAQEYPQYAVSNWIGHNIKVSARHYLQIPQELYNKVAGNRSQKNFTFSE